LEKISTNIAKVNSRGIGVVLDKNNNTLLEVPFSLPNEQVQFTLDDEGQAKLIRLEPSSSDRSEPRCPQFTKCGGCSLQHASESFVSNWKKSIVVDKLKRRNIYSNFLTSFVTPERSRRRAVFSGRRTKKGTIVGFHSPRSNNLVSIAGCIILDCRILSFLPGMEQIVGLGCTRSSAIKIYVSNSENGLDVYVEGAKPLDLVLQESIASIAVEYQLARLSWDGELIASIKPPVQIMGNVKIIPPERFFMQATKDSEMVMVQDICESLEDETIVADLFSGCGTFTLPLSQTKKVMAFENSFQMLKALDNAYRDAPNLKIIETSIRNLRNNPLSPDELSGIGGAVVNPPRSGAADQCKELAKSKVKKVLIVSCNPETFSRDASILIMGGYNLDWVRIIDQFRWSHHIEVIGNFSKNF